MKLWYWIKGLFRKKRGKRYVSDLEFDETKINLDYFNEQQLTDIMKLAEKKIDNSKYNKVIFPSSENKNTKH